MKISINNCELNTKITFSKAKNVSNKNLTETSIFNVPIAVKCTLPGFEGQGNLYCEKRDFEYLLKGLKSIYQTFKGKAWFKHNDGFFELVFTPLIDEKILVVVFLKNQLQNAMLNFQFETDQTFIKNVISEIELF